MNRVFEFDNRFTTSLPSDPEATNNRRQVLHASYSRVQPTPVSDPHLVVYSPEMADELGLTAEELRSPRFLNVFAGNALYEGMDPFAMNYGGHQFGSWAGQLGDGRAINLGEVNTPSGAHWTLQLKGAGPTPYSRTADGRAVLRSSIREFLCSEAMFHLGVPTTRALSLVVTGDSVLRDMFYDGNPAYEPGAVVCRVAHSFIRFGNFQIHAARQEQELLNQLIDHCIQSDFPHLGPPSPDVYLRWFQEVCNRTADLVTHWMRVGFVHGVMNTDNMSILGQTIDYGPYGWVDDYNLDWTPNTTDAHSRRYVFGNQAAVAEWNLAQLARAIHPIIGSVEEVGSILMTFSARFKDSFSTMTAHKLGLSSLNKKAEDTADNEGLFESLEKLFAEYETDMTMFFRLLGTVNPSDTPAKQWETLSRAQYVAHAGIDTKPITAWATWLSRWSNQVLKDPIGSDTTKRTGLMNATNPKYVLRNYLAQQAIELAYEGDYSMIHELMDVLRTPYSEQPTYERYFAKRPEWARNKPGSSMLSCSS